MYLLTCLALTTVTMAFAQFSEEALTPRAKGKEVVSNVNNELRKIFPDDHNFMDRLACKESDNGLNPNTYRAGYYGGIYQVDRIGFEDTQDVTSHPGLSQKYEKIQEQFGIDWPSATWEDLEKPAYSGIASRLYISNIPEPIPSNPEEQGQYWKNYYNTNAGAGDPSNFPDKREAVLQSRAAGNNKNVTDFVNCPSCICQSNIIHRYYI